MRAGRVGERKCGDSVVVLLLPFVLWPCLASCYAEWTVHVRPATHEERVVSGIEGLFSRFRPFGRPVR